MTSQMLLFVMLSFDLQRDKGSHAPTERPTTVLHKWFNVIGCAYDLRWQSLQCLLMARKTEKAVLDCL